MFFLGLNTCVLRREAGAYDRKRLKMKRLVSCPIELMQYITLAPHDSAILAISRASLKRHERKKGSSKGSNRFPRTIVNTDVDTSADSGGGSLGSSAVSEL